MFLRYITIIPLCLFFLLNGFPVVSSNILPDINAYAQEFKETNDLYENTNPELANVEKKNTEAEEEDFDDDEDIDGFGDDDESGFEEGESGFENLKYDIANVESDEEKNHRFSGFLKEETAYAFMKENPYLSKTRSILNLQLDSRFGERWKGKFVVNGFYDFAYRIEGRDEFADETLDIYESEVELRDFYIDGLLTDSIRLKIGRQIIAWGETEVSQITDVANPRDLREIGIVNLEDARIPVAASKLSWSGSSTELNMVAIHEIRANKTGSKGSDFDPFIIERNQGIIVKDDDVPESKIENTEYMVRLFKSTNGGDFGFVYADVYDDTFYPELTNLDVSMVTQANPNPLVELTPKHKRVQMYGFNGNMVSGSWLFKMEANQTFNKAMAISRSNVRQQITQYVTDYGEYRVREMTALQMGVPFSEEPPVNNVETWSKKNTLQSMLGLEYSGINDWTFILEGSMEHVEGYESNLDKERNQGAVSLMAIWETLNARLKHTLFLVHLTHEDGNIYRYTAEYEIMDALKVDGGVIFYDAPCKDSFIYPYRKQERVFMGLKYSF